MSAQGKTYVSTDDRKIREEKIFNFVKKYHLDLLKPGVASYKKKYENVVIHGSAIIFSREYLNKYIHALLSGTILLWRRRFVIFKNV